MVNLSCFRKPELCGQTVLPDRSVLIGQKLVENAKIKNSNATFWVILKQCELVENDLKSLILSATNQRVSLNPNAPNSIRNVSTKQGKVKRDNFIDFQRLWLGLPSVSKLNLHQKHQSPKSIPKCGCLLGTRQHGITVVQSKLERKKLLISTSTFILENKREENISLKRFYVHTIGNKALQYFSSQGYL